MDWHDEESDRQMDAGDSFVIFGFYLKCFQLFSVDFDPITTAAWSHSQPIVTLFMSW